MNVNILYFAAVRELVAIDEESIALPADVCTIQQLAAHLETLHEPLKGRMSSVRLARNEAFADAHEKIEDGDTIALIPPVAGG